MAHSRPGILSLPFILRENTFNSAPRVSIITPTFNHAHYLEDTLIGVNRQSYQNLEHIVIDAGSSDNTIEILEKFPEVIWVSEPDKGVLDAFLKGLRMARGKYVMVCFNSDMYIDAGWVESCVLVLEQDPTASLVWGGVASANVCGEIFEKHSWPGFKRQVPSGIDMLSYWLVTSVNLPETNYCVRREVLESCLSEMDIPDNADESKEDMNLLFQFRFHNQGYLAKYLPRTANFVRMHDDQGTLRAKTSGIFEVRMAVYGERHRDYRKQLLLGRKKHVVRDSNGEVIRFIRWSYLLRSVWKQKWQIMLKGQI